MHIRRNGQHRNDQGFTIQSIERALRDRDIHVAQSTDPSPSRIPLNAKTLLLHKPVPAPIGHFFTLVKQGTTWHLWDNQACTASFSCLTECTHHFEACSVFYTSWLQIGLWDASNGCLCYTPDMMTCTSFWGVGLYISCQLMERHRDLFAPSLVCSW